jgi:hypothetical protein
VAPPERIAALAGLPVSPEHEMLVAFAALVRADSLLKSAFNPIVLVESPTREAMGSFGAFTAVIQPYQVRPVERPSSREESHLGIMMSFYVPSEPTEEDSLLWGLDLGSYVRALATTGAPLKKAGVGITVGVPDVLQLTPLMTTDGVRILTFRLIYLAIVDPAAGAFA